MSALEVRPHYIPWYLIVLHLLFFSLLCIMGVEAHEALVSTELFCEFNCYDDLAFG
jgi:hypothetical protein